MVDQPPADGLDLFGTLLLGGRRALLLGRVIIVGSRAGDALVIKHVERE